jgi:hypothetical protein
MKVQVGGQESRNIFPQAEKGRSLPPSVNPPSPLNLSQGPCKYLKMNKIENDASSQSKHRRQAAG